MVVFPWGTEIKYFSGKDENGTKDNITMSPYTWCIYAAFFKSNLDIPALLPQRQRAMHLLLFLNIHMQRYSYWFSFWDMRRGIQVLKKFQFQHCQRNVLLLTWSKYIIKYNVSSFNLKCMHFIFDLRSFALELWMSVILRVYLTIYVWLVSLQTSQS